MGNISFWEFILRILVLYVFVMIALRVMGKREIGQLSVFDFVISVMLAELSTLPMEDTNVPLYRSIICITALVVLQLIVALLQLKSHRFRHWADGEPSVLIERGEIKDKEMRRMRYTMHDLLTQLREKGFLDVADVEFAILETSGQLSVFPKSEAKPITVKDMNIAVAPEGIPLPLIIDGQPVEKTLKKLQKDTAWLEQEISYRGYANMKEIFFATIQEDGQIHIDELDPKDQN